jgi:hypothetical protein
MRLRRFREDWQLFRDRGWPILRYETLVREPEATLRSACDGMGLPWDPGMMSWPKRKEDFAAPAHGSPTFRASLGGASNFIDAVNPKLSDLKTKNIPPADLDWMESEFAEFNRAMNYIEAAPRVEPSGFSNSRALPKWENTRRYRKSQKPLAKLTAAAAKWKATLQGKDSNPEPRD